jgi:catechol 2,3-dioxygenase-like lactoylglutathione lyase family enzyme
MSLRALSVAREIRHVGLPVSSLEAAEAFYAGFLGFEVVADFPDCRGPYYDALTGIDGVRIHIRILSLDQGDRIELLEFPAETAAKAAAAARICDVGRWHLAVTVRDLRALCETGRARGVEFVSDPLPSPDGRVEVCFCRDRDGNLVELVEPRERRSP